MAGDWIKLDTTTPDKPEVDAIAEALGIDSDAAVGKLVRFWIWADQQSICNALSVTEKLIDRVTHQPGFAKALQKVGWLEGSSGSFTIPRFDRHNGQTAKARALTNKRVARHRDPDCNAASVTSALPEKRERIYKTPPRGRVREVVTLPTRDEVLAFAQTAGVPADVAGVWFDETDARPITPDGAWTDKNGQPIARWQSALKAYSAKWAANDAGRSLRPGRPQEASKRQPSIWEAKHKVEALQRELERIKADPQMRRPKPETPWESEFTTEGRAAAAAVRNRIKELQAIIAA